MKKIIISFIVAVSMFGVVSADDNAMTALKKNPTKITLGNVVELCSGDVLEDKKACYSFFRGVFAGFALSRKHIKLGIDDGICIPSDETPHGLSTFMTMFFTKAMQDKAKVNMEMDAVGAWYGLMINETFCSKK